MAECTIRDIARMAGVSISTVSRVVNGQPGASPEVRDQILSLCQQHHYRTNTLARSLSSHRSGLIGCIIPELNNPIFAEIALFLEQRVREHGCHLMVCHHPSTTERLDENIEFLISHRVDGILLINSCITCEKPVSKYLRSLPIVLLGNGNPDEAPLLQTVCNDDYLGGRLAAEYLYKLGHRNILYIGLREQSSAHLLRCRGFRDFADTHGMAVTVQGFSTLRSDAPSGYRMMRDYLFSGKQCTAVFASSDAVAIGAMQALDEFGCRIPEDISLMGYDDSTYADLPNISLTTIKQQKSELARTAIDCLIRKIEAGDTTPGKPIRVQPFLTERTSCRPLKSEQKGECT